MGCVTSTENSTSSSFMGKRFRLNRSKKHYKVKKTPTISETESLPKTNLPIATRTTDAIAICDDFRDGCDDEKSYGYFSESISTSNNSDLSFNVNDCDLKMEMYMMYKISKVMEKTSSPILPTRNSLRQMSSRTGVEHEISEEHQQGSSYNKWKRHLQRTPPYVLNNVTQIPEAIAGQFSPESFPGYTDVRICQRAIKTQNLNIVRY